MKKISTLLFLSTLLTITVYAKYDDPQLSISSFSTAGNVQVEVDGRRYYFDNDKSIIIRNLRPGYHSIKVSKEKKRSNSNRIFNLGNRREVVYNSSVNLRSGYDYDITINKFGKVFTDEARIDPNDWNDIDRDREWDRNKDRDRGRDRTGQDDRDYDRNGDYDRNNDYGNGYNREMSSADFNRAKQTLRNEMFENTRVDLAKQVINSNYFTSKQVKELLQLFTFENNKLDLAKYAYGYTVDKNNYYLTSDQLTFSTSKDELARYIRTYREQ